MTSRLSDQAEKLTCTIPDKAKDTVKKKFENHSDRNF